ncbi:MAG: sugar transferase [Oscillospiraceae bacterium]|nr:sugar transferase [Oscillospiraceae bacterium]
MKSAYRSFFKRVLDVVGSLSAIAVLSPVMLLTALLVRLLMGGPVIFAQERPGKDAKLFRIYKFRTMTNEVDAYGVLLPDEQRLTGFGSFLRSTSLDELPEFFNILKGDMSLVGPRPLLTSYLPLYSDVQKRRHEVRPGLSGLAQVSGRNLLSWEEKFDMDVRYVDNITSAGDLKIIVATVINVLKREGISAENSATTEPFTGTAPSIVRRF